jgi:hypothetical protein
VWGYDQWRIQDPESGGANFKTPINNINISIYYYFPLFIYDNGNAQTINMCNWIKSSLSFLLKLCKMW